MINVEIEAEAWLEALPDAETRARDAARSALEEAEQPDADVTIALSDDAEVATLNARFRGKTGSTNVLSFPAPETARPHLGDIILAYGTCAREAAEQAKPLGWHLSHLVAHGVLHLLGWNHGTDAEAEAMETIERTVLARLGVADPYSAEDETDGQRRRPR
jgi:probable rRNA maturation factor